MFVAKSMVKWYVHEKFSVLGHRSVGHMGRRSLQINDPLSSVVGWGDTSSSLPPAFNSADE